MAKTQTGQVLAKLATAIDTVGEEKVVKTLDSLCVTKPIPATEKKDSGHDSIFPNVTSIYKKQKLYRVVQTIAAAAKCEPYEIVFGSRSCNPVISYSYKMFVCFSKNKLNCSPGEICTMLGLKSEIAYWHALRKIRQLDPTHPADTELYQLYMEVKKAMEKVK